MTYTSDSLRVCRQDDHAAGIHVGMYASPNDEEALHLVDTVAALLEASSIPLVIHVEHMGSGVLAPPGWRFLVSLATSLLEQHDLLTAKLLGVCLQCNTLDTRGKFALACFRALYRSQTPFEVVFGDDEAFETLQRMSRRGMPCITCDTSTEDHDECAYKVE